MKKNEQEVKNDGGDEQLKAAAQNSASQEVESQELVESSDSQEVASQGAVQMKSIQVEVPAQFADFAHGMAELVKALKGSLADGFQPGTDLPVIVTQAIQNLGPIVQNAQGIAPALKEHKLASGIVLALAIEEALK
jgi:soluble cytochrome b562